jgi:hypothetical protein
MSGLAAYGTHLWDGTNDLTHVVSISGGGVTLDLEDTTAHDSTGAWEEAVGTVLRSGVITIEINYDPSDARHKEILTRIIARTPITTYEIHMPGGEVWDYAAMLVTGFDPAMPATGKLTSTITMKPTGVVTPPA